MKLNFYKTFALMLFVALMMPLHSFAQSTLKTATFDDLKLEKDSFWIGADKTGGFENGSFKFDISYNEYPGGAWWSGFAYSNVTATDFIGYDDKSHYGNAVGSGYNKSANFVVANAGSWSPASLSVLGEGGTINGFYITNAANAYKTIINGDALAHKFDKGDWLMVTITDTVSKKKVEYYLADYRSENEADRYVLDTWQWVDLRSLGNVKSLTFVVTGSDVGEGGLNTPAYFCMDDFNGKREITEAPAQIVEDGSVIDLSKFFVFEDNKATETYSIDEVSEGSGVELKLNGKNLEVKGNVEKKFNVIVKAVKKGKVYFKSITFTGKQLTSTFEDLKLEKESYWNGADLTGGFVSGSYKFNNSYTPEYASWNGFAYSNVTAKEFISYGDSTHYACAVGKGYGDSENFVVANAGSWMPASMNVLSEGETINGFYITNAANAYKTITTGDSFAHKFDKGDWLMVTITDTISKKKVEYYLADYRSENEADRYVLDTWQWVDLRSLGNVKSLTFVVSGSDSGEHGLNTPAYFCMDDFNGKREITEAAAQTVKEGTSIDLAQFFTFDNNDASVAYAVDEVSVKEGFEMTITDGKLNIKGDANGEFTVIIKAVKKGKVYYASLPVTFTSSIEGVDAENSEVTERYSIDGVRMNNSFKGVNVIRTNDGKVKKVLVK